MSSFAGSDLLLSGERFAIEYQIVGSEREAIALAKDAALEQSVELPQALVTDDRLRAYVGKVQASEPYGESAWLVEVSYPVELAHSVPALLSVVYSNISFYRGIRIHRVTIPESLLKRFSGPKFGREGLVRRVGARRPALVGSALKPVGASASTLAETARIFAMNGIEIIKEDHGLNDQASAPFVDRVRACTNAIARVYSETGRTTLYFANVTGRAGETHDNALRARDLGASGVEILPGLCGFDEIRALAEDPDFDLPIMMHPANLGAYAMSRREGMSFAFLFGQMARLCGADISAFPSFGGRFQIDREECRRVGEELNRPLGTLKSAFSMAGGGQSIGRLKETLDVYGDGTVFLISGALFQGPHGLEANCRAFRDAADRLFADASAPRR
jgi:ribulose-bisphosphate carboxylase large chain